MKFVRYILNKELLYNVVAVVENEFTQFNKNEAFYCKTRFFQKVLVWIVKVYRGGESDAQLWFIPAIREVHYK